MLSIPDRMQSETSLKDILLAIYGSIFTVHRLDKETSGVIVFAKNEQTHKYLSLAFENRNVEKYYAGIVIGTPHNESGTIDAAISEHPLQKGKMVVHAKGKNAVTDYEVMESFGLFSLVKFRIHTGRTHQVRVHAKQMGNPLVCDELYGDGKPVLISSFKKKYKLSKNELEEKPILARIGLHAQQLTFTDVSGKKHDLNADMPKDMRAMLQQLRKYKK